MYLKEILKKKKKNISDMKRYDTLAQTTLIKGVTVKAKKKVYSI